MRLLRLLANQTLSASEYEVVVVDDGSKADVVPTLEALALPYTLHAVRQANAGPASARHNAIMRANGALLVIVDDDMQVAPTFLAEHVAAHADAAKRVVLGRVRPVEGEVLPLFERCHLALTAKLEARVLAGSNELRGTYLYTGNVSFRKADYLEVGGFDRAFRISEDAELGVRFDLAGAEFRFAPAAVALHASDHTSLAAWMRRSTNYGRADSLVSEKHATLAWANPWRIFFLMSALGRPLLFASATVPLVMRPVSWLAMYVAMGFAAVGVEKVALAGATVVYGLRYFIGVREHAGSLSRVLDGMRRFRAGRGLERRVS